MSCSRRRRSTDGPFNLPGAIATRAISGGWRATDPAFGSHGSASVFPKAPISSGTSDTEVLDYRLPPIDLLGRSFRCDDIAGEHPQAALLTHTANVRIHGTTKSRPTAQQTSKSRPAAAGLDFGQATVSEVAGPDPSVLAAYACKSGMLGFYRLIGEPEDVEGTCPCAQKLGQCSDMPTEAHGTVSGQACPLKISAVTFGPFGR